MNNLLRFSVLILLTTLATFAYSQIDVDFDSNSSNAHITLKEITTSSSGAARLRLEHSENSSDRFEMLGLLSPLSDHMVGWAYNNSLRVTWNEDNNGLGIGTTQPAEKLHVNVSGFDGIFIDGDGTGDARLWINNNNGNHFLFDDFSDNHAFKISSANEFAINVGGTERIRIDDDSFGEMGINAAPLSGYQLYAETELLTFAFRGDSKNTGTAVGVSGEADGGGTGNKFGVDGQVDNSGTTGSAYGVRGVASTTPNNFWAVYALGDLGYSGSLSGPSDERLKKDIQNLEPVLDKVLQLETKRYQFDRESNPELHLASGPQIGFIAQDVQKYFPTMIDLNTIHTKTEDGDEGTEVMNLKMLEMIPVLAKAIQEQQEIINAMQAEIDVLKEDK